MSIQVLRADANLNVSSKYGRNDRRNGTMAYVLPAQVGEMITQRALFEADPAGGACLLWC